MTDSPWRTPKEAADYTRCSVDTLLDALRSQELRGYQSGSGGRWRIHLDDLDAWVRGEVADVQIPAVSRRRAS